ncbi:hypothetical protein ACFX5Q_22260 [Mesorhizobium sp. IMUNJ 23033]|uniref:hypothetical protein n=1 Tax=Mesorhizobium sp. IMUNJ 23033 TaxID=3378039 RepID=UPI003850E66C
MYGQRARSFVAKCPHPYCGEPHQYVEITFPMINDRGGWVIECKKCKKHFTVTLRNPTESIAKGFLIADCWDDDDGEYLGSAPSAEEIAKFSLDMNPDVLRFNYGQSAIYYCSDNGDEMESSALAQLRSMLPYVHAELAKAQNFSLAGRSPDVTHVAVRLRVPCACGATHHAVFYCPFRLDLLPQAEDMLLADVEGTSLEENLTGIFSKSFLMDALEKLVARWRLKFDQVVIASPFIAHQYMTKSQKLEIWEWLLGILDPSRTTFITRATSYNDYKAALLETGLDHKVLVDFGLENRIVAADAKKQDFHAKVYIGLGETSEVLSGSANLVRGPSFENASFLSLTKERIRKRYLDPLGVVLKAPAPRAKYHLLIEERDGKWRADFLAGASPI